MNADKYSVNSMISTLKLSKMEINIIICSQSKEEANIKTFCRVKSNYINTWMNICYMNNLAYL